jgi:hypothetical protein
MRFDEFWEMVKGGGRARMQKGGELEYSVVSKNGEEKLKIKSTRSENDNYYITKRTAAKYFDEPKNPNHHWFNVVFKYIKS